MGDTETATNKTGSLLKLEELIGLPIVVSKDKQVRIHALDTMHRKIDIDGYVASESNKSLFHTTKIEYEPRSKTILYGECSCESAKYRGWPCKHMLRLRAVYQSNY